MQILSPTLLLIAGLASAVRVADNTDPLQNAGPVWIVLAAHADTLPLFILGDE